MSRLAEGRLFETSRQSTSRGSLERAAEWSGRGVDEVWLFMSASSSSSFLSAIGALMDSSISAPREDERFGCWPESRAIPERDCNKFKNYKALRNKSSYWMNKRMGAVSKTLLTIIHIDSQLHTFARLFRVMNHFAQFLNAQFLNARCPS